jgi:toxin ParE1/3/4
VAEVTWADPALNDLDAIAEYIALDNPAAASKLVEEIMNRVDQLTDFPHSGRIPPELPDSVYRELIVPPCRIFYRGDSDHVFILHVMREERQLRRFLLENR